jgi:hypothetical protein
MELIWRAGGMVHWEVCQKQKRAGGATGLAVPIQASPHLAQKYLHSLGAKKMFSNDNFHQINVAFEIFYEM